MASGKLRVSFTSLVIFGQQSEWAQTILQLWLSNASVSLSTNQLVVSWHV